MRKNEESLQELWGTIMRTDFCITKVPEGEEKERARKHILRNNNWKLPKSGEGCQHPGTRSPENSNKIQPKEEFTKIHPNQTIKNQRPKRKRQKNNSESSERKETHHTKGSPNAAISRFLSRNFAGQERVGWYIKSAEEKKNAS